jgi:hypothetical protein
MIVMLNRSVCVCLAIVLILSVASPLSAAPLWNADFSGMTPGASPSTAAAVAGQVNTQPSSFAAPLNTSVLIQGSYTDSLLGTVFGNGNVVVLSDNSNASSSPASQSCSLSFNGDNSDAAASGRLLVSFDLMLDSAFTANIFFYGYNTSNQLISYLMFSVNGSISMLAYSPPGTAGSSQTAANAFAKGTPTHVDLLLDLDVGAQSLSVNGLPKLTGTIVTTSNVDAFSFFTGSSSVTRMAVDNFEVAVVPEPSGAWLLVVGALVPLVGSLRLRRTPAGER